VVGVRGNVPFRVSLLLGMHARTLAFVAHRGDSYVGMLVPVSLLKALAPAQPLQPSLHALQLVWKALVVSVGAGAGARAATASGCENQPLGPHRPSHPNGSAPCASAAPAASTITTVTTAASRDAVGGSIQAPVSALASTGGDDNATPEALFAALASLLEAVSPPPSTDPGRGRSSDQLFVTTGCLACGAVVLLQHGPRVAAAVPASLASFVAWAKADYGASTVAAASPAAAPVQLQLRQAALAALAASVDAQQWAVEADPFPADTSGLTGDAGLAVAWFRRSVEARAAPAARGVGGRGGRVVPRVGAAPAHGPGTGAALGVCAAVAGVLSVAYVKLFPDVPPVAARAAADAAAAAEAAAAAPMACPYGFGHAAGDALPAGHPPVLAAGVGQGVARGSAASAAASTLAPAAGAAGPAAWWVWVATAACLLALLTLWVAQRRRAHSRARAAARAQSGPAAVGRLVSGMLWARAPATTPPPA
jgi:hypothetical protein